VRPRSGGRGREQVESSVGSEQLVGPGPAVGQSESVIALWLGHENVETTQIYLHADLALKERAEAIARVTPPNSIPGRYRPPDTILAFLASL
jgi:hypothetical protein